VKGVVRLAAAVLLVACAWAAWGDVARASARRNAIQVENSKPGSPGWAAGLKDSSTQVTNAPIQGYASEISVLPGQAVHVHVDVHPAARYRIDVYRLGWYGGSGARLLACIPGCGRSSLGRTHAIPAADPATGELAAHWPVSARIRIPRAWVSGYYIAKLEVTSGRRRGKANYVPFVVRSRAAHASTILVQASVNAWEAYNNWAGKSLYAFNSVGGAATKASFDRPFSYAGQRTLFDWEYQLARFLERRGYDVSYTTDVDTDRDPGELLRHNLVLVSGHDEYWSKQIRDAFEAALSSGVNLAFMGADIGDWQIRYEDNGRTIVEYRDAALDPEPDPALKTTTFRDLVPARPQCQLLGIQYQGGFRSDFPLPTSYSANPAALDDPWFAGTGLSPSSALPGLVGYEWDGVQAGCATPALTVLFHAAGPPDADAVRYVASSGARVFSSGSLQFVWGLDNWGHAGSQVDSRLQRFMVNALRDLTRRPGT
jgi:hypothetical protein